MSARYPTLLAISALAAALLTAGCSSAPTYTRPDTPVPAAFKEGGPWKTAEPRPAGSDLAWWKVYGDPVLDGLEADALAANQTLKQSEAAWRQAQALTNQARAGLFPTAGASVGASRARSNTTGSRLATTDSAGLSASWQPDFWGGVRSSVDAAGASAQASSDDLAAARLSIQSTLAQNYFLLRVTDALRALYATTIDAYEKALKLAQAQRAAGTALLSDVSLAQSQLATARAAAVDLEATRQQYEHAIAVLTGRAASSFTLAPTQPSDTVAWNLPSTPVGLPSQLLERRPDIAAAERRVAAANANIGVARAAYFPAVTLSASGGYAGPTFGDLFSVPTRVWSLGATLAQTIFDGGLRDARNTQAAAAYDAAVASYRQAVLTSFQQVEDQLTALDVLGREAVFQQQAVDAARTSERLALAQYRGGTATYLSVITAQTLSLTAQRTAMQLRGRQIVATVSLIAATGGGFDSTDVAATTAPATAADTPSSQAAPALTDPIPAEPRS